MIHQFWMASALLFSRSNSNRSQSYRNGLFCKKEDVNHALSRRLIPFRRCLTKSLRVSAPFFLLFCLTACGSGSSSSSTNPKLPDSQSKQPPAILEIQIAPSHATLLVGDRQPFAATVLDAAGQAVVGIEVSWKIDDPAVGRLFSDGSVEGLKAGTTTLTASFGEVTSNEALLEVVPPPSTPPSAASVDLTGPPQPLFIGNQVQFVATPKDTEGNPIPGVVLTWTSSRTEIVSIDQHGSATAIAAGSATLTAMAENGISKSMVVTVSADNTAPTARKTTTATSGSVPLTVTFDARESSDPDGSILSHTWDFGDGFPSVKGAVIDHTYESAGEFTATLTVADNRGAIGTVSATITVNSPSPPPTPGAGWQRSGVNGDLFGIHFVSVSEGWTVGIDQVIAHTTDGGATWMLQKNLIFNGSPSPETASIDFYDVFFIDARTGWAVGWPEAIFKTTDGGATWVEQHLHRGYWGDRNGDGLWDRKDWCEVWNSTGQYCTKKLGVYLRKVQFADSQHGWTVGRFGFIFKSDDGGTTWRAIPQNSTVRPLPAPCVYPAGHPQAGQPRPEVVSFNPHLFTVDVIRPNEVWIGGGSEGDEPCETGWLRMIGHTTDDGQTWRFFYEAENGGQLEGNGRIFDLKFSRNTDGSAGPIGWAVGGNGTTRANALQTTDSGQTWHQVRAASSFSNAYYGLAFLSPSDIWMAGWGGLILHSDDGGANWRRQTSATTSQLRRLFFSDGNHGWIAGQGQVFRTVSGGD
jgi:photosystem II stability/assembly factor-like uncharacterized protein